MTVSSRNEVYDLMILVDATYSMDKYLTALQTSLPKIIAISNLTGSFSRIGLLAYRDYSEAHQFEDKLLEWSGWHGGDDGFGGADTAFVAAHTLTTMVANLKADGGGDYPEATKTGLARAYQLMRKDATTIILLYTDAPPHCWMVADQDRDSNYYLEQQALRHPSSYSGYGHKFADWVSAGKILHEGEKKAHVFCFLDQELGGRPLYGSYYTYLSAITRGACFSLIRPTAQEIAETTVDMLLAWMGAGKAGEETRMKATLMQYKNEKNIENITTEQDELANAYFWATSKKPKDNEVNLSLFEARQHQEQILRLDGNLARIHVTSSVLEKYLPKRRTAIMDFAKRYMEDTTYKALVVWQLQNIIETDVTSMSLNPVFGVLWRAVCGDRANPAREKLLAAFSLHIDRIAHPDEKARMKVWLENSYDYDSEIVDILDEIPEHQRFPCVFLDPTISFAPAPARGAAQQEDEEENQDQPMSAFRRDELLEIGRSCDGRILRRLGKVLTRITYVESAAKLPAHIAAMSNKDVPKIPTILASQQFGQKFWKILLHVVLPGTMLAARPAALLAALAFKIGLKPLYEAASEALFFWRDKWNDLDIPENWNSSCLGLLLDADAEYRKQLNLPAGHSSNDGLLFSQDRKLFDQLLTYHHTGTNFLTTLTAEVGWTPKKTQAPIGPVVVCRECKYPRSITIMAETSGGKCGICVQLQSSCPTVQYKERVTHANVSLEDVASTKIAWVECSTQTCRAQYVCYNTVDLNVRPKCFYCLSQTNLPPEKQSKDPAPTVECTKCLSKIIWPGEWRSLATRPFLCTACVDGIKTIVGVETNAEQICKENGQGWLIQIKNSAITQPFTQSLFKTIARTGTQSFLDNIEVLPDVQPATTTLTLQGKQIRNAVAMIANLRSWTQRRVSEKSNCSLCFSTFAKPRLLPACRRHGCNQSICEICLNSWYGLNTPGTTINTAALFCPFCRRAPVARVLAAHGNGIHAVANLTAAYKDRGSWIHAWCSECNKAARLMERRCARGAPEALRLWKCEDCNEKALARARLVEALARRELERLGDHGERMAAERNLRNAEIARKRLDCPVRECPGCNVLVEKTYGCDHITCLCGTHWCWACGEAGSCAEDVYDHMDRVHGDMYEGEGHLGYDLEDEEGY